MALVGVPIVLQVSVQSQIQSQSQTQSPSQSQTVPQCVTQSHSQSQTQSQSQSLRLRLPQPQPQALDWGLRLRYGCGNRSASDVTVSRFRLSSMKLRNHKVGKFDPLLWAVRMTIIELLKLFVLVVKYSVVSYLCSIRYGRYIWWRDLFKCCFVYNSQHPAVIHPVALINHIPVHA